jgi:hypothetical protein
MNTSKLVLKNFTTVPPAFSLFLITCVISHKAHKACKVLWGKNNQWFVINSVKKITAAGIANIDRYR